MGTKTTATRGKTRTTNRAERWTRLREAVRGNYGLAKVEELNATSFTLVDSRKTSRQHCL